MRYILLSAGLAVLPIAALALTAGEPVAPARVPLPAADEHTAAHTETAVLAGGCFWGVQGVFQHVRGVDQAVSGYTGGTKADAQYETVATGTTGAAESVKITFDPAKVSYGQLLHIYFTVAHDPTELDHQGPDEGTQYRSAIFPQTPEQEAVARAYIAQLNAAHIYASKVVTSVEPGKQFFPAEDYHQNFLTYNPDYPYIAYNDLPKVRALQASFPQFYRAEPVLVPGITKKVEG